MRKLVTSFIWKVYFIMQRHYITFRFLMWLKELGVMRGISYWVKRFNNKAGRSEKAMQRSREFFSSNAERVERVFSMLTDEKSKAVMGG